MGDLLVTPFFISSNMPSTQRHGMKGACLWDIYIKKSTSESAYQGVRVEKAGPQLSITLADLLRFNHRLNSHDTMRSLPWVLTHEIYESSGGY